MREPFDVVIVGAGVVGCAIAREMVRYRLRVGVVERELDLAMGNSSRNSGVLHGGFTYKTGSLRAQVCIEGNREFDTVARELGVPFKRTGKVVVGFNETDMRRLERFKRQGEANGASGLEIIDRERLQSLDPSANGEFALYSPNSGILDPIAYTLALARNAARNGAEFLFDHEVTGARREGDFWVIEAGEETLQTRWVVNSAGLGAAKISEMLGISGHTVRGFKGEYFVLDKKAGASLRMPVYPAPDEKGGFATHATPTIDGNVLIGPDSYVVDDLEDFSTTKPRMDGLVRDGLKMFSLVKPEYFIRNFAGIRAKRVDPITGEVLDFVVEARDEALGTINLMGIESPGLTGALPLARRAVALMAARETLVSNSVFEPNEIAPTRFSLAGEAERAVLIERNPDYGEVICRCETVTAAEVLEAIREPLGAKTIDGVKLRTRATMGRCQGGYCQTRIALALSRELGLEPDEVLLGRKGSRMFSGRVRE